MTHRNPTRTVDADDTVGRPEPADSDRERPAGLTYVTTQVSIVPPFFAHIYRLPDGRKWAEREDVTTTEAIRGRRLS